MSEMLPLPLWELFARLFVIITFFWNMLVLEEGSLYTAVFNFLGARLQHQHVRIVRHVITCIHWAIVQQQSMGDTSFQQPGNTFTSLCRYCVPSGISHTCLLTVLPQTNLKIFILIAYVTLPNLCFGFFFHIFVPICDAVICFPLKCSL